MTARKETLAAIPVLLLPVVAIFWPSLLLDAGWLIRSWSLIALAAFAILLLPLFFSQGTLSLGLGMLAHTSLYIICLLGSWVGGATGGETILGIFPASDAVGYLQDAILLASGQDFTSFSARRPIFPGALAAGLGWTDFNLKIVLIVLAATVSVAAFLFSKQVARLFGPVVGFLSLFLTFLFYRRFLGSLMTETLGLSLGLLGAALLLRSLHTVRYRVTLAAYGMFVLTMALLARAGAFLVLPAIFLFLWRQGRQGARLSILQNWQSAVASVTAIGAAFGCNSLVRHWTGATNVLFANAAYTYYGMAAGYKGWYQFHIDHPEFDGVREPMIINHIVDATLALVRHQPLQLVRAVVLSLGDFFVRVFGFAKLNFVFESSRAHLTSNLIVFGLLNLCFFFGLFRLWKGRSAMTGAAFLLLACAGMWLSAPLVPPIDSDSMRAYAATFPLLLLVTAIGIASLFGSRLQGQVVPDRPVLAMLILLSAPLLVVTILGPWFGRGSASRQFAQVQKTCPAGEKSYVFQTRPDLYVDLVENSGHALKDSYPSTRLDVEAARRGAEFTSNREELRQLSAGTTIFMGRELADHRIRFFVADTSDVASKKGTLGACGDYRGDDQGNLEWFTLVKLHSLEELSVP